METPADDEAPPWRVGKAAAPAAAAAAADDDAPPWRLKPKDAAPKAAPKADVLGLSAAQRTHARLVLFLPGIRFSTHRSCVRAAKLLCWKPAVYPDSISEAAAVTPELLKLQLKLSYSARQEWCFGRF